MTKIDKFVEFARDLPAEMLQSLESALDEIMQVFSRDNDLTAEEIAELKRRVTDPNRKRADPEAVARIFGKKLPE